MSSNNNTNFDYKELIISQLDILRKDESSNGNPFKAKAYSLVINQLKICIHPIYSFDDLKNVTGIGEKIHKKIEEIFSTNKLKKAEAILANPSNNSKQIFENVYGIGPTKSKDLVERYNIRTILELRNAVKSDPSILNDKQKIGLQYYEDLIQRIPRKEMDIHNEYITTKINQISKGKLKCCIVGSYRRQSESSGDIDVLITATNSELSELEINALFVNCVNSMMKETYIIEVLANGSKKNMSICRLGKDGVARRLDLLLTPISEYYYSILYFTGSQSFNIKMRSKALEMSYSLNEHGLTYIGNSKSKALPSLPKINSEKDVFDFLKMDYLKPENRV